MIDKLPPQALDIEEAILGAVMLEKEALQDVVALLRPEMFYKNAHFTIYSAISDLYNKNTSVDILTVTQELRNRNKLDEVGGPFYISNLTNAVSTTANIHHHVKILTQLFIKREIIRIGIEIIQDSYDLNTDIFDSLNELENNVSHVNSFIIGNEASGDIKIEAEKTYQQLIATREARITGISTGNHTLTQVTGGWNDGDLVILAARPSHGKTTRALHFALHAAFDNKKVAFFSIEMKKESLHEKMFLNVGNLDSETIRTQSWSVDELEQLKQAKERIRHSGMFIYDSSSITPLKLKTICRERKRKHGLDIIFIDYLQKMKPNVRSYSREAEVSEISTALKELAMELNVPVIALAQLNRECEQRTNKRPMVSDLRESGTIEQDADLILSLYSPSKYYDLYDDRDYKDKNISEDAYKLLSEMSILKHRNGSSGFTIIEQFDKSKSLFI